jgi:hypothetical protein
VARGGTKRRWPTEGPSRSGSLAGWRIVPANDNRARGLGPALRRIVLGVVLLGLVVLFLGLLRYLT